MPFARRSVCQGRAPVYCRMSASVSMVGAAPPARSQCQNQPASTATLCHQTYAAVRRAGEDDSATTLCAKAGQYPHQSAFMALALSPSNVNANLVGSLTYPSIRRASTSSRSGRVGRMSRRRLQAPMLKPTPVSLSCHFGTASTIHPMLRSAQSRNAQLSLTHAASSVSHRQMAGGSGSKHLSRKWP